MRFTLLLKLAPLAYVTTVLFGAHQASAQDAATQPSQPAGAEPGASFTSPPVDEPHEQSRLRIGFNVNGGVGTHADLSGPAFGTTFRVGYQHNRLLGFYGNLSSIGWIGASTRAADGTKLDVNPVLSGQLTPMLSLTPVDLLEIAVGPSLDYFTGGEVRNGGATKSAGFFSDVNIGAHGRLALHLGSRNERTGHRRGFTIGGDVHTTFVDSGPVAFMTLGLGYDWM
jgi:hypothetical protein